MEKGISALATKGEEEGQPKATFADLETGCCRNKGSESETLACKAGAMDDWLQIPPRRRGIPAGRLCLMMAVTLLTLWVGAPVLFAMAARVL